MGVLIPGKLLFLATPRTGSVAIKRALMELPGAQILPSQHALKSEVTNYDGEYTVSTVRNPFDILVSWFCLNYRGSSFKEFLLTYTYPTLTVKGTLFYHADVSDLVLRYGEDGINTVLRQQGISEIQPERVNVTPNKRPYRTYYDDETISIVEKKYAADLKKFGYTW